MPSIISQISELAHKVDENLRFPESEALVPLNPHKIGPYMAGAALTIDTPDPIDRLSGLSENLQATYDYLDTAPNDTCYNDRFAEIFTDTLAVQSMCELGGDIGAVAAGVYASKKAETYMETAVKESAELSFEDDFNMEVMRQGAKERGLDPALVRGVGPLKQNLRPELRTNPFIGPYSPGKRPIWAYRHIRPLRFIDVTMLVVRLPGCTKAVTNIVGERIFRTVLISLSIYLYYRYLNYLYFRIKDTVTYIQIRIYIRNVSRRICYKKQIRVKGLF